MTSAFEFLKDIGLVPAEVTWMRVEKARLDMDPDRINVGYLASFAYEWDKEGESSPVDFLNAVGAECKGAKRDLIAETLTMLGREKAAETGAAA